MNVYNLSAQVEALQLANFELFSSSIENFNVFTSSRYRLLERTGKVLYIYKISNLVESVVLSWIVIYFSTGVLGQLCLLLMFTVSARLLYIMFICRLPIYNYWI